VPFKGGPTTRLPLALWSCFVAAAIAGCGGAPAGSTSTASSTPPTPLECESAAYPCAFADVGDDARAETERLAAEATRQFNEGATNDAVVAWLRAQASVAEVEGDADAIRFRPAGGRGVWIVPPPIAAPQAVAYRALAVVGAGTLAAGTLATVPPAGREQTVTGAGQSERRARVLSPFRWDFGASDDGRAVAERLRQLPDYANGVDYAENATVSGSDVTVDDFRGWQGLQVVHVVSHGFRLCRDGKCRAVVAANALPDGVANIWASAVRGLELEVVAGAGAAPQRPRFFSLLGADFFHDQYPGGLTDAVVFLNGCATFGQGATDLGDAIRGSSSVVLGWSRSVINEDAQAAALAMYDELAGDGRTVADALERLGGLSISEWQNAAGQSVVSTLASSGRAAGGDLRIREIVDFEDAAGTPLPDGAAVPLVGKPDDGQADAVTWQLRVEGIEQQAASAMVRVTIDGHAGPPVAVSTGSMQPNDAWLLSGTLDLGVDVSVPHQAQFEASIELPEGGESVDVVSATLVGPQPTPAVPQFGSEWRGHVTQRSEVPHDGVWTVAEADLVFTLVPQTAPSPFFVFEVTGGTMTFSVSGTDSEGCTFELSPVEIPITPDMAESAQGFTIDASGSPPTFRGFVHIVGPVVEVMQTCPAPYEYLTGPYSTSATGIFIDVGSDEERAVIGDRISGTSLDGSKTFDISRAD